MPSKVSKCIPARVVLALLCATGVMELYISRTNLSIAIVVMVQTVTPGKSASNSSALEPFCLRDNGSMNRYSTSLANSTLEEDFFRENLTDNDNQVNTDVPPIKMTALQRGNVLSAFFYAYGLSGIFGGRLAEIYGTKIVFGTAVAVDALANFLIPVAAKRSYGLLFAIRFIMGIFQGACYPSLHTATAKWIPPLEQPSFIAFVYPANSFGTIFTLTVCGLIISKWGWESVFYVSGSISLLWLVFWISLAYDNPDQHPRISKEEKMYIQKSKEKNKKLKPKKVPWFKMLLSLPLWAINIAHAGNSLGLSFFLTQLPLYMSSIIGVNIRNNGFLSSIPFLARYCFGNFISWIVKIVTKKWNPPKKRLKIILTIIGYLGPAIGLLLVGYMGCKTIAAISFFILAMALNGANFSGASCNHLDLTTNFSGTALGISTTVGYLYAMIGPVLVGALTPEETLGEWIIVYWLMFSNYIIAGSFYCLFLSTERQSWDFEEEVEEQMEELKKEEIDNGIENVKDKSLA